MLRSFRFAGVGVLAALLVACSGPSFAQGPGPGRARRPGAEPFGPQAGLALRALNLTDAQKEQVRQITQQRREQMRGIAERVRNAQEARRRAVESIPTDESRIRAAMQELADAETELALQQAALYNEIYAVLTPDQRAQAEKLRADREARMKDRQQRFRQRQRRPA